MRVHAVSAEAGAGTAANSSKDRNAALTRAEDRRACRQAGARPTAVRSAERGRLARAPRSHASATSRESARSPWAAPATPEAGRPGRSRPPLLASTKSGDRLPHPAGTVLRADGRFRSRHGGDTTRLPQLHRPCPRRAAAAEGTRALTSFRILPPLPIKPSEPNGSGGFVVGAIRRSGPERSWPVSPHSTNTRRRRAARFESSCSRPDKSPIRSLQGNRQGESV